jgi:hypothetical protein
MDSVQIDRCRLLSFRAGDQPLSSQFEIGTEAAKQQIPDSERQKPHYDPNKSRIHKHLPSFTNSSVYSTFLPKTPSVVDHLLLPATLLPLFLLKVTDSSRRQGNRPGDDK